MGIAGLIPLSPSRLRKEKGLNASAFRPFFPAPKRAFKWYRRLDSNQHGLPHHPLKMACLPISPLRRGFVTPGSGHPALHLSSLRKNAVLRSLRARFTRSPHILWGMGGFLNRPAAHECAALVRSSDFAKFELLTYLKKPTLPVAGRRRRCSSGSSDRSRRYPAWQVRSAHFEPVAPLRDPPRNRHPAG